MKLTYRSPTDFVVFWINACDGIFGDKEARLFDLEEITQEGVGTHAFGRAGQPDSTVKPVVR